MTPTLLSDDMTEQELADTAAHQRTQAREVALAVVAPRDAHFCTEVIIGTTFCPDHGTRCRRDECARRHGTDTDYFHLYTLRRPTAAEVTGYLREGWYKIEAHTRQTGH
jgi:hypothetical protein